MLVEALGVQLLTIPYKGTAPAMNDLLGKQVDLLCDQTTNTTQQINAGSVKAYAVTSLQRVPTLSKLPTMDESGFKGFEVGIWHGMWVPKARQARGRQAHQKPAGRPGRSQVPGPHETAGRHGANQEANPQALDAKVSSRCRSGPSCSRRRASSSNKPRDPRRKPLSQERGFWPLIRAGAGALKARQACRAQAQPRNVSACRLSPLAPPETGGS